MTDALLLDVLVPGGLTPAQLQELTGRLEQAIEIAQGLRGIHPVYEAEANAYRRVLQTIAEILG